MFVLNERRNTRGFQARAEQVRLFRFAECRDGFQFAARNRLTSLSLSTPADVIGLELQLLTVYIVRKFSQFLPRTYIRITEHRRSARPHDKRVEQFSEKARG